MVRQCVRCLYRSTHPFGLTFDQQGLCSGCITHEEKYSLDWLGRWRLLENKIARYCKQRKKDDRYDCIVPIRGTPEYFYVLDVVKNRLGLNPLVVSFNSQFNSKVGIRNLDLIRDIFDVDLVHYTSNPNVYRKLIRESLSVFNSMRWPFLAGETQFPVSMAVEKGVPLVIWPYHQPTEQVGVHSYLEECEMTRRSRHEFDLMSVEPHELIDVGSLAQPTDVEDLHYPSNRQLEKVGVVGIYLSNYIPWDSRRFSEDMIERYGAGAAKNPRTFDTYDRIDDMTYMTVHDVLKQAKTGYSRVTDSLCREIRFGRILKEDAKGIEKYFQAQYPELEIRDFLAWLGMKPAGFNWLLERLPHRVSDGLDPPVLTDFQREFVESFTVNHGLVHDQRSYIIYGKGLEV